MTLELHCCPYCRTPLNVLALVKSEATKELLAKLATLDTLSGNALMAYLMLFAPPKTGLSADRCLRLINEVEELADGDWGRLALAMATTADNILAKRQKGEETTQFTKHNYLEKVLASTPTGQQLAPKVMGLPAGKSAQVSPATSRPQSATMGALQTLEDMKYE